MKLTILKVCQLYDALSALDGLEQVFVIGGENRLVKKPYDFSGKVKWNLAKNVRILRPHVEAFQKVRDDIVKEVTGGKNTITDKDGGQWDAVLAKVQEVQSQEEDVTGLLAFTTKDLGLDSDDLTSNQIPLKVLEALDFLITD
jgi:hypothetical protein